MAVLLYSGFSFIWKFCQEPDVRRDLHDSGVASGEGFGVDMCLVSRHCSRVLKIFRESMKNVSF